MLYIAVALFLFLDAVIVHLMICRRRPVGLYLKLFLGIALINLILTWIVFWILLHPAKLVSEELGTVPLWGTATAIYILLIPTYLVFYFSTQQISPSKKILLLLSDHQSMSVDELAVHFTNQELVLPRIHDLITTGCVVEHQGWYVLTPTGLRMAKAYEIYQWVLGRAKGG